jgi:flagellum-specific ATP synthase
MDKDSILADKVEPSGDPFLERLDRAGAALAHLAPTWLEGRILSASGLSVDIAGLGGLVSIGDRLELTNRAGAPVAAEIIGLHLGAARAMTLEPIEGVGLGEVVRARWPLSGTTLRVCDGWIGRVIDPLGRPLDGKAPPQAGMTPSPVRRPPGQGVS